MTKRFDEEVRVEHDAGLPCGVRVARAALRGRRRDRQVADRRSVVVRRRDREYWRVEARGGAVWDLYFDRQRDLWHMERLWD